MDRDIFRQRLVEAADNALSLARRLVTNSLPSSYLFLLYPNQSYDGNPLEGDEEIYPQESLPDGKYLGPFGVEQSVDYLWRDGKVPEWVNVSVQACDRRDTHLELLCCGRYTALDELLYHEQEGYQPFHVLGPKLPPNWESIEASPKFDLYWHGRNPLLEHENTLQRLLHKVRLRGRD